MEPLVAVVGWYLSRVVVDCSNAAIQRIFTQVVYSVGLSSSYLVDPASSHMLVSKIKPCMSKYKQLYTVKLRMAH